MLRRLLMSSLFLMPLAACAQPSAPAVSATTAVSSTATAIVASSAATAPVASTIDANAPRLGVDYEILPTAQPTYGTPGQGKIEVAEVFSYACIHCAEFQPSVNLWKKTQPADVRWEYVPGVFGGSWDLFARAYYAAEILGVQAKTHDAVFKAVHVDHAVKSGTAEEIASMYASFGVDRDKFLATMQSFGVTAKLNRAKQFALRTGITATPTIIINGKYRVNITRDGGFDGMLVTVNYLIARERALGAPAKKS